MLEEPYDQVQKVTQKQNQHLDSKEVHTKPCYTNINTEHQYMLMLISKHVHMKIALFHSQNEGQHLQILNLHESCGGEKKGTVYHSHSHFTNRKLSPRWFPWLI